MSDANLGDGANGRLSETEYREMRSLFRGRLGDEVQSFIEGLLTARAAIVREHTERAWDEGWTRGAKDMNETVRWGETNCERPTNPYAARQEQDR